jgi:hypothetical protein
MSISAMLRFIRILFGAMLLLSMSGWAAPEGVQSPASGERRLLFVATPGIRDYLEYGGHGILVFDIGRGHKFLKRIESAGVDEKGKPLNVKGICANAPTGRLYVSTTKTLMSFELSTGKMLWEKPYEDGCDRMAVTPDGKRMFMPSLEKDHWLILDPLSGEVIKKLVLNSGSHNTIIGLDGRFAYLAGLKSPVLRVADTRTMFVAREIGPFGNVIRPFTINRDQTMCYINVNDLLGFEIAELAKGKVLARVEVNGFKVGETKRHGCPSHGIGLTPDEKEIWLTDAANSRVHIFDNTSMPPKQVTSILLRDQPGWITFSIDGQYAYPSTGDVIEVKSRSIVTKLTDEKGGAVQSEKMVEVDVTGDSPWKAVRTGDQFGLGRTASE